MVTMNDSLLKIVEEADLGIDPDALLADALADTLENASVEDEEDDDPIDNGVEFND